ncbi:hypothetical protein B0H14DRAFT_655778 [Mycena olivaceomarginata]|nr:hypothetical protein B0H14DRAFT_655778 [Mycena olivaceomarginata]
MLGSCKRSVRQYASVATKAKKPKKAAPPKPAPVPAAPSLSLRDRMLLAQQRNWEKREGEAHRAAAPPTMDESLSEEENQMKMVEQIETQRDFMRKQGRTPPVITLPLLDHMIPYAVRFKTRKEYPSVLEMYRQFKRNRVNDGKNAFSMRHIATADSFPGVEVNPSSAGSAHCTSTQRASSRRSPSSPTRGSRRCARRCSEQYIQLNEAITKGNTKRITDLTMPPFTAEATALDLPCFNCGIYSGLSTFSRLAPMDATIKIQFPRTKDSVLIVVLIHQRGIEPRLAVDSDGTMVPNSVGACTTHHWCFSSLLLCNIPLSEF